MNIQERKRKRGAAISYLKRIAAHFYLKSKSGIAAPIKQAADVASAIYTLEFNPNKRVAGDKNLAIRARAAVIPSFLEATQRLRASKKPRYQRAANYLELALKDALL